MVTDAEQAAAAKAYAAGDRLFREGQPEAALASLLQAIALRPDHPGAKNFAGWLLTTRHRGDPTALLQGIGLLAEAHALAPEEDRPLQNLVEALVVAGRRALALEIMDTAVAARPHAAQPWNLRGWLRGLGDGADDPKGAIEDLEQAIARWTWYGDAHFNLARVLLGLGVEARAREEFAVALQCRNCFRPVECHQRLGELEARRGRWRRALGHFRRGAELDASGAHAAAMVTGVQRCGGALQQAQGYFLHALDEARRTAAIESGEAPRRPAPLRSLAKRARALLATLDVSWVPVREAVEQVLVCAEASALPWQYSDRSQVLMLELAAASAATPPALREQLHALATRWIDAQRSLYDELLAREESDPEPGARAEIVAHASVRAWQTALAGLEALDTRADVDLLWRAATAEELAHRARRDGDAATASALYQVALRDFEAYASAASSGAEGASRTIDVERLRGYLSASDDR